MAGLGKGLKALAGSVTPPKKDINPLLKQMDQMLTLDDPNKIAEFYSPVISAIDKMPIALEGTKGENIMGYLNKRAPNVSKAELESFSLRLNPQQKYTREQIKELAKQQGSEKYSIEVIDPKTVPYFDEIELDEVGGTELEDVGNFGDWRNIQRQNPIDKEIGFIGLKLQGEKNYYKNDNTHFGGVENIGHSRTSIREVMPEGGPLQQKIKDRETYLFIEEAQSDVAKSQQDVLLNREKFREDGTYTETRTIYPNSPDDLIELDMVVTRDTIGDLQYEAEQSNISIDPAVLKTITDFLKAAYKDVYFYDNFKEVQRKNTELAEELRDKLKEEHNLNIYTGKTPQKVAELATLESLSELDTGNRIEPGTHSFEGEVMEIWETFPETLEGEAKYNSSLELDPKEISSEFGYKGTLKSIRKLSPVQTRSEYLKKLLLANIAYAKQQGINKVVIPDYREIARARVPNFIDEIEAGTNRELYRKYYEAVEKGTEEQFKQNYYETMFKPLYKDALKKVTNELKSETNGAIKVKPRNIKYKDLTEKKGFRNSDATELDITDFEFDPSTQQIRFAEGGAIPMEEQMELFRDRSRSLEEPEMKKGIYKEMEPSWDLSSREYDGKEINIITFKDGKELSMPQIEYMFEKNKSAAEPIPSKATSKEILNFLNEKNPTREEFINYFSGKRLNKGGIPMEEQMKLFEEGGLRDEGGMVDEVSGNDVPIGSTRKEVRDDIPAMLSEGEFVFPADVVRFLGLERLMNLRQEAKMGLKQMEAMGQMGNSDEATMPDDLPFGMADLVIVEGEMEPQKKAHGGVIHAQQGTFVTPIFDPQNQDVRPYTNDGGQTVRYIPFLDGDPVYPIPEGYVPLDQATAPEAEETPEAIPTGGDDGPTSTPEPSEFQKAGGWDMDFGDPPDANKVELWIKEAEKVSTFGKLTTGIAAAINPLMGAAAYAGGKANEKGIKDNLQRALDAASKTPVKGQMKRINNVDERLTTKTGQGILGKALTEIFGTLAPNLNLTKEEEQKVKTNIGTGDPQPEPPKDKQPPTEEPTPTETPPEVEAPTVSPVQDIAPPEVGYTPLNDARDMLDEIPTPFVDESAMNMLDEIIESAKTPTAIDQTDEMLSASGAATADYSAPLVTAKDEVSKSIENIRVGRGENDPSGAVGLENLSNLLLESYAAESRTGGEVTKGPSDQPTSYVAGQQRRKPKVKTITPTSSNDDDDGPNFADMKNKMKAEQAAATADFKTAEVAAKAQDKGASQAQVDKIISEGAKVKEKLEQQAKGIKTGFKKGGLASRKK